MFGLVCRVGKSGGLLLGKRGTNCNVLIRDVVLYFIRLGGGSNQVFLLKSSQFNSFQQWWKV